MWPLYREPGPKTRRTLIIIVLIAPYIVGIVFLADKWLRHPTLDLASGGKGGLYIRLGDQLAGVLNDGFSGKVRFKNVPTRGSSENLDMVQRGDVDLALAQDGLDAGQNITALARLYTSPLHIAVPTNPRIKSLGQLASRGTQKLNVFLGAENSGTWTVSEVVLEHYGLKPANFNIQGRDWNFEAAVDALTAGKIDAAFFLVGFGSDALSRLAKDGRFTLLDIDRAEGIIAAHPYLEKSVISPSSYASSHPFPAQPVNTVATRELLICNRNLPKQMAYRIVEVLFQSSSKLVRNFPLLTQLSRIEPERNFYYPLHPGAIAFYTRAPSYFNWQLAIAFMSYSLSVGTVLLLWLRRRRVRQLVQSIGTIDAGNIEDGGPAAEHSDRQQQVLLDVQRQALELYMRGKIGEDGYRLVKESIAFAKHDSDSQPAVDKSTHSADAKGTE